MKKKVLSLGLCVAMTAALMPTVMVQATGTEFPEYLYVSDFTDGMDKFEIVGNSTYNVASDADGNLVITPTVAQWSNDGTIYLTGSEDWEEYKLEADIKLLGTAQNYLMLAPNHAKEAVNNSDSGFLVFDNGEMFKHDAGGLQIKSWHHQTLKYTVNVNGLDVSADVRYPGETDDVAQALVSKVPFTQRGGFAIRTMWSSGNTVIKSIKVTDLRAKAYAFNTEELVPGDVITVKFSEAMDFGSVTSETVYIDDNGYKIPVTMTNDGVDDLYITIPEDILANNTYTLVIEKEVTNLAGERMNNDKKFEITTAEKEFSVSDLILKVDGVEPASVKSGDVVTVSAYAKNNSVEKQNAVLIIAVYDDDRLIEVKFTPISLEGKTDDTFYISDYTIPQGENITASVMVWDGLKTVKSLAKNKLY